MTDDIIKRLRDAIAALNTTTAYALARSDYDLASSPDNIAALLDRLDASERALKAARDWIAAERQSFVECARNPIAEDGRDMSHEDRAVLADYDGILAEIGAARAAEQSDERREG